MGLGRRHRSPRSCSTLALRPATVNDPVRFPPSFLPTLNVTVPLPVPLEPDVMVIHEWLLLAVHTHRLVVETLTDAEPPAGPTS